MTRYIPLDDQLMPSSLPTIRLEHAMAFPQVAARNYYHWVIEALSRLMIAKEILDRDPRIVLLVPANPPRSKNPGARRPFILQYLDLLGYSGTQRVLAYNGDTHRVAITTMYYADWYNRSPRPGMHFCPPQAALLAIRRQFAPTHLPVQQRPNVVLISRADTGVRKLVNENELVLALNQTAQRHGKLFQLFVGAALSIAQTIELFQSARIVVAPHGAGLANMVFCGEKSTVIELPIQETHGRDMAHLAQALGLDYWMAATSTRPFHFLSHISADLEELTRIVEQVLNRDNVVPTQQS